MNISQDTDNKSWDLGFSNIIEETPIVDPKQHTQFRRVNQADGMHIYMMRPMPSWSGLDNSRMQYTF